jgi:hypothetical protein
VSIRLRGWAFCKIEFIFKPDNNGTHIHDSDRVDEETKEFIVMDDLRRHWEERHHDEL